MACFRKFRLYLYQVVTAASMLSACSLNISPYCFLFCGHAGGASGWSVVWFVKLLVTHVAGMMVFYVYTMLLVGNIGS